MTAPAYSPEYKEGWSASLVTHLFGKDFRTKHPKEYGQDVQFLFDWESSVHGSTRLDPLNLNKSGDYATPNAAMLASDSFIRHHPDLLHALQKGQRKQAVSAVEGFGTAVTGGNKMPSKIDKKTGAYDTAKMPNLLQQIGGTITDLPGAVGKDLSNATIGGFLGKHAVLIVLVLALVLVLMKRR